MLDLGLHQKRKILVVDSNVQDVNTANGRAVGADCGAGSV